MSNVAVPPIIPIVQVSARIPCGVATSLHCAGSPARPAASASRASRLRILFSLTAIGRASQLPLHTYLWTVLKNTSRAERLSCFAAIIALAVCITLILYFTIGSQFTNIPEDVAPHEWRITRPMWLADERFSTNLTTDRYNPLEIIIINHSATSDCYTFKSCAAMVRTIQRLNFGERYDIAYNFLIGNDGRVYEGRGWNRTAAHTYGFNSCSVGIGFIGDYREELPAYSKVTTAQINRTMMLLEEGVREGYLRPNYYIIAARDIQTTNQSPGSNLYNELRKWKHYDHDKIVIGKRNCTHFYGY
ncbi:hypothetical protein ACJJTC_000882 [Scirpophaga incertulas]